jgi:arylformamidase
MKPQWVDISVPLRTGMVNWPGDPHVTIAPLKDMERGGSSNVGMISMSTHTGTHMDAPRHMLRDGESLDALPLEATIGPARVIEIRDRESIKAAELLEHRIRRGERILFKTYGSARRWQKPEFDPDYVYVTAEAARFLASRGVRTVGVDYLSVGGYNESNHETHGILLKAGIWIIEGLNLSGVKPGRYDLVCLPLRVANGDGAPARAALSARTRSSP